jgi:hypothetical protein
MRSRQKSKPIMQRNSNKDIIGPDIIKPPGYCYPDGFYDLFRLYLHPLHIMRSSLRQP